MARADITLSSIAECVRVFPLTCKSRSRIQVLQALSAGAAAVLDKHSYCPVFLFLFSVLLYMCRMYGFGYGYGSSQVTRNMSNTYDRFDFITVHQKNRIALI
jgi:coenzyme F420-reducing hydrogenase delta subunit